MIFTNKEYLKPAVYGLMVADALGVPFEFKERDSFKVEGMSGYGTHHTLQKRKYRLYQF